MVKKKDRTVEEILAQLEKEVDVDHGIPDYAVTAQMLADRLEISRASAVHILQRKVKTGKWQMKKKASYLHYWYFPVEDEESE